MKRICLCFAVFLVVLTCSIARAFPQKNLYTYSVSREDIVKTVTTQDISYFNNCKIGSSGNIEITGDDAFVVFDVYSSFGYVVLNTDIAKEDYQVQVFLDSGTGISEINSVRTFNIKGQNQVVIAKGGSGIQSIRVDVDAPYRLVSVDFHSSEATLVPYEQKTPVKDYVISVAFALIITALVFFLDLKYRFSQKVFAFICKKKKALWVGLLFLIVSGIIASGIDYLFLRFIIGTYSKGFYLFFFIFLTAVIFSVFYLAFSFKTTGKNIESVFLCICLVLGLLMVVITPFGHNSWDTETHYKWSLRASYSNNDAIITQTEKGIITGSVDTFVKDNASEIVGDICRLNDQYKIFLEKEKGTTTIAHYLSGMFIALGRMVGANFYEIFTFGKLANLLVYATVCYFAVKKLKSGKMIMIVIALFPTNLMLATSYSYDYWVTAFGFLGMAYFVSGLQAPEKSVSVTDTIIMCAAFSISAIPKLIYAVLLIIPFFMNKEKIEKPKRYYFICTLTIVVLLTVLAVKVFAQASSAGDIRGGSDVSPPDQIAFILSNPLRYAKILFKFLTKYLSMGLMKEYIVNYGYCGMGIGANVFVALMMITTLTDKSNYDVQAYGWFLRSFMILLFLGMSAAIATALYIDFTPVGHETVNGCQLRYLIPLLYPLLSVICGKGIKLRINRSVYNYICLIMCVAVNYVNIYTVLLSRWK